MITAVTKYPTFDYEAYALRRDASTIAKFVARCSAWEEKYYMFKHYNGEFPKAIAKSAKYPSYEAASRIERHLGLTTHASSVPQLAELVAVALTAIK